MTAVKKPWLDKDNMELWLQVPVKEIVAEDNSVKGMNFLSNVKRLEVKTENEVIPLFVKCRIEEGEVADTFRETSIFGREQEMYGHILSKMSQIVHEAIPDSFEAFSAKSYYTYKCFLVLEDLKVSGFKLEDRKRALDLDQCLLVMRTLGRFHAASFVLHQKNPNIFQKLDKSIFSEDEIVEPFQRFWSGMSKSLADLVDAWGEEWHKYAVKLRRLAVDLMKRVQEVTLRQDSGFNVLNHGDLWTNNIMLKNKTEDIRFVDFQWTHYTSPGIDLHYFITTSANLDVRRNHINHLIEEYHRSLCETMTALGYEGRLVTLEEIHREYDKKALFGVIVLLGPCAVMVTDDDWFNFDEVLTTGWNPEPTRMHGELYKEFVKIMLPLFDAKGAFDVYT